MKVPHLGNHLVLDFVNVEHDLNDYEFLDKNIREILAQTSVNIENCVHKKFDP